MYGNPTSYGYTLNLVRGKNVAEYNWKWDNEKETGKVNVIIKDSNVTGYFFVDKVEAEIKSK